ncbi:MAG: hypothetical protein Q8O67_32240 [Deltaproteobacteria bacterium]|nr:hypothetical protein [Deltaproteobacteria bacterium]
MFAFALLASLATAEPLKVLVLDLSAEGVPTSTASLVRDEITVSLGHDLRLEVLSTEDLRRAVSVEAEKMSLGCNEASCLAEIGQAMGARYIVHGSIGALGSTTVVHLSLFDGEQSRAIARETVEAKNADDLLPNVRTALDKIRTRMLGTAGGDVDAGLSLGTLVGGGATAVGAAGLVIGSVMMGLAWPTFDNRAPPPSGPSPEQRASAQRGGQAGTILAAAGVVVVGAGVGALIFWE